MKEFRCGDVYVATVRNVNVALRHLMELSQSPSLWRSVSPRGMHTWEYRGIFITEYTNPRERVLFSAVRDANPFFHFMESLWILDGRDDVAFLNQFNSNISTYSDDGKTFNAPYGHRLRRHFSRLKTWQPVNDFKPPIEQDDALDQLSEVIELLRRDPETRRAVLCLWDPIRDLNVESKDIPCNDLVTFKLRDGTLDMTVMNRSNDAMWGAYGANAVQFSFLQEFVACALNADVGRYRQISDSFHVYTGQKAWLECREAFLNGDAVSTCDTFDNFEDPYADQFGRLNFRLMPLMEVGDTDWREWLRQNHLFLNDQLGSYTGHIMPFFHSAAVPIMTAWRRYKAGDLDKSVRIDAAQDTLRERCEAEDWAVACIRWLERRRK